MNGLERKLNPRNAIDQARAHRDEIELLKRRKVIAGALDEISDDAGTQQFFTLVSGDGSDPTDPNFIGEVMCNPPMVINGIPYTRVGLNCGVVQYGLSAITGAALFAEGAGTIDRFGINLNGQRYAIRHFATDAVGENPRYGVYEMRIPDGGTIPALTISFFDATSQPELAENGDYETGDATGHTLTVPTGTTLAVTTDAPYSGTYALHGYHHSLSGAPNDMTVIDTLDAIPVTAGDRYLFQAASNVRQTLQPGALSGNCRMEISATLKWYTEGSALISSQLASAYAIPGGLGGGYDKGWNLIVNTVTAPATAASAVIEAKCRFLTYAANMYQEWNLDNISLVRIPMYRDLHFSPDLEYFDGTYSSPLGAGPLWGASVTDGQDKTADTASSFNSQATTIKAGQDIRISNVLWDLPYAGDYELWLLNSQTITDSWKKLWSGTVSTGGQIDMALADPLVIHGGSTVYLAVKKVGAAVKWGSKQVSSYKGADILISGHWFDGAVNAGYTPGVRLTYQVGTWG
jgi:hypothetical protein